MADASNSVPGVRAAIDKQIREGDFLSPVASVTYTRATTATTNVIPALYASTLTATAIVTDLVAAFGALANEVNANRKLLNSVIYGLQTNRIAGS